MTRTQPLCAIAIAIAMSVATAAPVRVARAQSKQQADDAATKRARKHHKRGEKLFALGRFEEALVAYEAAFEASPLPHFLFNIGQCHRNLGNFDQAIFSFRKYLKLWPDAPNRTAVLELIDELEIEREEAREAERRRKLALGKPTPAPTPRKPKKRRKSGGLHTKWWFWAGVAGAAAATTGGILLLSGDDPATLPGSDLGNVDFSR